MGPGVPVPWGVPMALGSSEGLQPARGQPWAELAPQGPCPPGASARPHSPCLEGLGFRSSKPWSCFKSGLQNSLRIDMKTNAFGVKPTPEQPSAPEGPRSGNAARSASYTGYRLSSHPSHISWFMGVTGLFYRVLNPFCTARRGRRDADNRQPGTFCLLVLECQRVSSSPSGCSPWHIPGDRARA